MKLNRILGNLLFALYFFVNGIHGGAHLFHNVPLGPAQYGFILIFFILFPIWALWKYHRGQEKFAFLILLISMIPASVFAFTYHFVLITPDNVCMFGNSLADLWFVVSAYMVSIVNFILIVFSAYVFLKSDVKGN
ncbi:hypothetical protein AB3N59_04780 [Leptospira sp. WS92.C1]